jgi:hypothetical protein
MKQHHAAPSLTPLEGAPLAATASSHPERLRRIASKARLPLNFVGVLAGDPEVSATLDDMGKRNTAPDLIDHTVHRVQVDTAWHSEEWANSCQTSPALRGRCPEGAEGDEAAPQTSYPLNLDARHCKRIHAVQQRGVVDGEAQLRDRDRETGPMETAQEQHKKRCIDDPNSSVGSPVATFLDHDGEAAEPHHDHGSLEHGSHNIDESTREEATLGDDVELAKWAAKLLGPDLIDGTAAYRHVLTNVRPNGARRGNPAIR